MKRCTMCERIMSDINPNPNCWPCMKKANKKMLPVIGSDISGQLEECNIVIRHRKAGVNIMDHQYYG